MQLMKTLSAWSYDCLYLVKRKTYYFPTFSLYSVSLLGATFKGIEFLPNIWDHWALTNFDYSWRENNNYNVSGVYATKFLKHLESDKKVLFNTTMDKTPFFVLIFGDIFYLIHSWLFQEEM